MANFRKVYCIYQQAVIIGGLLCPVIVIGTSAHAQQDALMRPASEARLPGTEAVSGVLRIPSAYVQRDQEITAFVASDRGTMGGILLGLGQRLELGGVIGDSRESGSRGFASAKVNLLPEALLSPAVSSGVLDAFDDSSEGRSTYIVVSKSLIPYFMDALAGQKRLALKLHAGYGDGIYHRQLFAGVELWGTNHIGALGEVAAGRVSLGAHYYHQGIGATLAWMECKRIGGTVSYTLPLR